MKKLYQADGHAVKEMLKIVSLLHEAIKINQTTDEGFYSVSDDDLSIKVRNKICMVELILLLITTLFSGADSRIKINSGTYATDNSKRIIIIRNIEKRTNFKGE